MLACWSVVAGLRTGGTNLGGGEDVLDGLGDLGTDTVTLDEADEVVAL